MQCIRVESFSVSVDGFGAGADQSLENPIGVGGKAFTSGRSPPARSGRCSVRTAGRPARTTGSPPAGSRTSGRGCWGGTCSARSAARGRTGRGRGGGATPRRTTARCSSSPTTRGSRWRWTAGRCSTSSPTGSSRHSGGRKRRQGKDVRIGGGVATIRQGLRAGLIDETAHRRLPRPAGPGRALVRRGGPGVSGVRVRRTGGHAARHPCGHGREKGSVAPRRAVCCARCQDSLLHLCEQPGRKRHTCVWAPHAPRRGVVAGAGTVFIP